LKIEPKRESIKEGNWRRPQKTAALYVGLGSIQGTLKVEGTLSNVASKTKFVDRGRKGEARAASRDSGRLAARLRGSGVWYADTQKSRRDLGEETGRTFFERRGIPANVRAKEQERGGAGGVCDHLSPGNNGELILEEH